MEQLYTWCEQPRRMSWTIVNIVATSDLKQEVDIQKIADLPDTIHDSEIFSGKVTYLKTPKMFGKVTIFPSGKLISIGTKSHEQAQSDLSHVGEILTASEFIKPIKLVAETRNIVALASMDVNFTLEIVSNVIGAMYEPEQFPGAVVKLQNPKATCLIFQSGKVIITGINNIADVEQAHSKIKQILSENADPT
jgi:transcription initiation factor TFIID TATA-box-binding protein